MRIFNTSAALLLATAALTATPIAAKTNKGNSTVSASSFFPANLARRLSPLNIVRRTKKDNKQELEKKKKVDESKSYAAELFKALMEAEEAVAKASASASPSCLPKATSTSKPQSQDDPSNWQPTASASAWASASARAKRNLEEVKSLIKESPWEILDSRLLCPTGETACPIFPRMGSYECVDTMTELESCGGCASRDEGVDCTAITGVQGVTCNRGRCQVFTCQPNYKLEKDLRGNNYCRKSRKETIG